MGWSYEHRPKGTPVRQALQAQLGEGYDIVESSIGLRVAYLAVASKRLGYTFGTVVLIDHTPLSGSPYYNFGTKWIDETMGPSDADPPRRVLEALDEEAVTNEWSQQWRARAWANLLKREARPRVRKGDVVTFATPIRFANGEEVSTFVFERHSYFRTARMNFFGAERYHIRGWREREYSVTAREA